MNGAIQLFITNQSKKKQKKKTVPKIIRKSGTDTINVKQKHVFMFTL